MKSKILSFGLTVSGSKHPADVDLMPTPVLDQSPDALRNETLRMTVAVGADDAEQNDQMIVWLTLADRPTHSVDPLCPQ